MHCKYNVGQILIAPRSRGGKLLHDLGRASSQLVGRLKIPRTANRSASSVKLLPQCTPRTLPDDPRRMANHPLLPRLGYLDQRLVAFACLCVESFEPSILTTSRPRRTSRTSSTLSSSQLSISFYSLLTALLYSCSRSCVPLPLLRRSVQTSRSCFWKRGRAFSIPYTRS